jgi:hypothetical protein
MEITYLNIFEVVDQGSVAGGKETRVVTFIGNTFQQTERMLMLALHGTVSTFTMTTVLFHLLQKARQQLTTSSGNNPTTTERIPCWNWSVRSKAAI